MSAGGVIGAIAAHTVITSTIRNQEAAEPQENTMTDAEATQAAHDMMGHFIRSATRFFVGILILMAVIVGLVLIFGS